MSDIEKCAFILRRAVSDAELRGEISEADTLAYIEVLYKIERALKGVVIPIQSKPGRLQPIP